MKILNKTKLHITLGEHINESGEKIVLEEPDNPAEIMAGDVKFKEKTAVITDESADKLNLAGFGSDFGFILFSPGNRREETIISRLQHRIILVGAGNFTKNLHYAVKNCKIRNFSAKKIFEESPREICDAVMENARQYENLCLIIDISVINQLGLSARELVYFLQRLKLLKNFRALVILVEEQRDEKELITKILTESS
ncbi:MAG TPA: hypothetical protein VI894_01630 [Candidatus Nanoarchaeia archaeon]|nr:hypothetical protein [Candidatus Nanoarchaeia archaeon]